MKLRFFVVPVGTEIVSYVKERGKIKFVSVAQELTKEIKVFIDDEFVDFKNDFWIFEFNDFERIAFQADVKEVVLTW